MVRVRSPRERTSRRKSLHGTEIAPWPHVPLENDAERRRSPRITEIQDLYGGLLPIGQPLPVYDLSSDGFCAGAPFEFLPDTEHLFEFSLPGGAHVRLSAVTVHCRRAGEPGAHALYRAGFSFVHVEPTDRLVILVMVDAMRASRQTINALGRSRR